MTMGDKDLIALQEARDAVERSYLAFQAVSKFDQAKIDAICEAMSSAALSDAERLGVLANEETGFGRAQDKKEKNRFAAQDVWAHFRSMKTVGVIRDAGGIVEIASPRGVVAAIIPSTNPTSTAIFKILIAIKSRNTIVLSPHPAASRCIQESARVMHEAGIGKGLPADAVYCIQNPTIEGTEELMKHRRTAVILATGGIGLVRAAYSSGKPAFGVGPGNVPVFVERSADVAKAAADILTGTCFDNGTICASEQSVVADAPIEARLRDEFRRGGGHFLSPADAEAVGKILLTPQRTLNAGIVGKSAEYIANLAGITVPSGTRCLIADCAGVGREYPWSIEKLSPTLAFFVVNGVDEGAKRCEEILQFGGMGHTAGMHSKDRAAAIEFGQKMPASRVVINSPTTHGAIGLTTDLAPSMTLGCGSWGGNVTSDNVSPIHLMDIKRVAFETKPINISKPERSTERPYSPEDVGSRKANISREKIASIVDQFLSKRISRTQEEDVEVRVPSVQEAPSPVKTIIHELRPQSLTENGDARIAVPFVSESDVRVAIDSGSKIYINAKTILTPSARDLGEEKDILVRV